MLILIALFSFAVQADNAALEKECFEQNKGRSCVSLGTALWQNPESREEARKAFSKGCELKIESACALKKLKSASGDQKAAKASTDAKAKPATAKDADKPAVTGVSKTGPSKYSVSRSAALSYAADLESTLSTAKMEADSLPGGPVRGYRFVEIDKGSVFEALGFLPKDVVTHVNGEAITSPSQATALIPSLAYKSDFAVKLIRAGKTITQDYQLAD